MDLSKALAGKYGLKKDDVFLLNKADDFDGTVHSNPIIDLGATHYCDRCDVLLSPVCIKCTSLSAGESVFFDITDENGGVVGSVVLTGKAGVPAARTLLGLEPGTYTVSPSRESWPWTYTLPAAKQKTIKALSEMSGEADFTVEFQLTKKETGVKNAESCKLNEIH